MARRILTTPWLSWSVNSNFGKRIRLVCMLWIYVGLQLKATYRKAQSNMAHKQTVEVTVLDRRYKDVVDFANKLENLK
jgi:hypothetical protein